MLNKNMNELLKISKRILELSHRIKWAEDELKDWIKFEAEVNKHLNKGKENG